ncbi:MAG: aspartate--tRNA(Asn) ligase [Anaerolineaceae bacterium]|jgi:aspartyl-tRNA synthetase|nr:aspartate--tRNA(Asn) ligase [Anaerolineaceae bacterium]MDD4042377.1 aspartate--tRNA(Asn) ligase [Anaerolineaceae bacterium]MDD4578329.1 aspartate--tRNA(Asn) ligase [Anaerolineaceae bacterium]
MERTLIKDLKEKIDQQVTLKGWLQTLRDQKSMQFLVLRDKTGLAQVAHWKKGNPELAGLISTLGTESALTVTGKVVANEVVKLGGIEIQLEELVVENNAELPLPFEPFSDTLPDQDYRLDWRYLDLRRERNRLIFEIQTTLEQAMREYWLANGFTEIHSPKIMGTPSESGAELFKVDYFDRTAYLAQSPQFYKQMAQAAGFERIFEIGPVFRADPSFTSRHMTEFTGIDFEMSWIDSHEDIMAFAENWLAHAYQVVKDKHHDAILEHFGVDLQVPQTPFPRMTMVEAYQILKGMDYKLPPEKKGDLDPGAERALGDFVKKEYGNDFVYVTDWPFTVRPFYHMLQPDNPALTRSFDLLGKGLEITTGAQREHRYEVLAKQALDKGLTLEPIQTYLNYFRYGTPPHGGLGMGLSRLLMVMLDLPSIRDAVFIFRGPNRLEP